MMWVECGAVSGMMLGVTDTLTKIETQKANPLSVLFTSSLFGSVFIVAAITLSTLVKGAPISELFATQAFLIAVPKNGLMVISLWLMYKSLSHIPLSYAGAIRASGPIWTLVGAYLLVGETLSINEAAGLILSIGVYILYAQTGRKEGILNISMSPLIAMLVATIMSSLGTAYDRYIASTGAASLDAIQVVSAIERVAFVGLLLIGLRQRPSFSRGSILLGILWASAEYIYFAAYSMEEAKATILALLRRLSLLTGLIGGVLIFKEKHLSRKFGLVIALLLASALIVL
jgi:bacterial/archaeal transporter family protein